MRAPLLWVATLALACGAGEPAPSAEAEVAVEVRRISLDLQDTPVVLLAERDGERLLPIWIGTAEARSIQLGLLGLSGPRPNSHDFAQRVVQGLRGEVLRVVVTDLREGTYYAVLTLLQAGEQVEIDARPSDAIALALRTGAPIFVRERLLDGHVDPSREEPRPARSI